MCWIPVKNIIILINYINFHLLQLLTYDNIKHHFIENENDMSSSINVI